MAAVLLAPQTLLAPRPETLPAAHAVTAWGAGRFREPIGFQQTRAGRYFVFDRPGPNV